MTGPSIEELVIRIQCRVRAFLERKRWLELRDIAQKADTSRLYSYLRLHRTAKWGTKAHRVSLFKVKEQPGERASDAGYVLEAREQNRLRNKVVNKVVTAMKDRRAAAKGSRGFAHLTKRTPYPNVRLPEDPAILGYYLEAATMMTVSEADGTVDVLKLMRMKVRPLDQAIQSRRNKYTAAQCVLIDKMGCNLKAQFLLHSYPRHLCKVYKRYRYQDPDKKRRIVKDWKIKVLQLEAPQSEDYIVVRRLPCKLSDIEGILQDTLGVQHNKRILPNSILHLYWKVFDVVIYSQKFYDFSQPRFEYQHVNTYYFSQSSVTGGRTPNARSINKKNWDPLYEVYIQKLVPKPS